MPTSMTQTIDFTFLLCVNTDIVKQCLDFSQLIDRVDFTYNYMARVLCVTFNEKKASELQRPFLLFIITSSD